MAETKLRLPARFDHIKCQRQCIVNEGAHCFITHTINCFTFYSLLLCANLAAVSNEDWKDYLEAEAQIGVEIMLLDVCVVKLHADVFE